MKREVCLPVCLSMFFSLFRNGDESVRNSLIKEKELRRTHEHLSPSLTPPAWLWMLTDAWAMSYSYIRLGFSLWILVRGREYQNFTFALSRVSCWWLSDSWLHLFSKGVKLDRPLCSSRLTSSPSLVPSLAYRTKALFGSHSSPSSPLTSCALWNN